MALTLQCRKTSNGGIDNRKGSTLRCEDVRRDPCQFCIVLLVSKMSDTISLTHFDFDFVGVTTVTAPHFAMDRSKESELS